MKKYKKKELLDALGTLKKMNTLFSRQGKNIPSVISLLTQCQETAIIIGNYLELFGNEGVAGVKSLEEYCENIYQMGVESDNDICWNKRIDTISKLLMQAECEIRRVLPDDKREIVFIPYKASMWDSMESIWREAVGDERCETYVIPVPYYDKNPDGSIGQIYYEGLEFPKEVKITDWNTYHMEERRPDVVYIHNPYDAWNKITSIHPNFYTEKIRPYTNKLVYIPYFCTMNYIEKHFCVMPGILYADAVVVQTDKVKNTYLEAISEFEQENDIDGTFSKDTNKFYVFGSPKFDKVMNIGNLQCEIPEEWRKKIYKEDGIPKKIILFNTSVQELLTHQNEQIIKIKKVIELFQKRKDNLVLWWRPHPLNESTMKSMLPQLLKDYQELEEDFQKEEKGIFDDTADLYRAIKLSDAYYGTGGSLIPLYGLTGKPILRENVQILDIRDNLFNRFVTFTDAYIDKDEALWFSAMEFNGLFKYDIKNNELLWKGRFPDEGYESRYRYTGCVAYKNKLFFPPFAAEQIAVYDRETGEFERIPIDTYGIQWKKIYAMAKYNEKMFCFGAMIPAILCVDLETYEVTYFEEAHRELSKYFINNELPILNRDIIVEGNICYLSSARANVVLEFHMNDYKYKIYQVGNKENYYLSMKKFRGKIYLIPRNAANVVCWDYVKGETHELLNTESYCEENMFFNTCEYEDELWLFAYFGKYNAKIPQKREQVELVEDMSAYTKDTFFDENADSFFGQKFSWAYSDETNMYYFCMMNKSFYIRNGKTGETKKRHLIMREEDYIKARVSYLFVDRELRRKALKCIYEESNRQTVANYMDWVIANDNLKSENQIQVFLSETAEGHLDCGRLCHEEFNIEEKSLEVCLQTHD